MALDDRRRIEVAAFLSHNYLFFLNLAMAAARATTGWAMTVADSSIVTTMSRNGTDFGVRLAGDDEWFLAPAPPIGQAMYYAGFGPETSAADVGDSAVLELIGLGGPAAGASPSVAAFVGGSMADAIATTTRPPLVLLFDAVPITGDSLSGQFITALESNARHLTPAELTDARTLADQLTQDHPADLPRIAAALTRGDRDRACELRELGAAARVHDRLLVLDPRPFRVS